MPVRGPWPSVSPCGVSAVFNAHLCRLAYAWSGNFLDASPVWNDRGGNPAHVLGTRIWTAPPGCPTGVTTSSEPPDFTNRRQRSRASAATIPEGKLYDGPAPFLQFEGYATDKQGVPTFRYHLKTGTDEGEEVTVSETIESLRFGGGGRPGPTVHAGGPRAAERLAAGRRVRRRAAAAGRQGDGRGPGL